MSLGRPPTLPRVKSLPICKELLTELVNLGIIVEFIDNDGSKYYQLRPYWRRIIYQLADPIGFNEEYFKMNEKPAREGFRPAPGGRTVPGSAMSLSKVNGGNKVE